MALWRRIYGKIFLIGTALAVLFLLLVLIFIKDPVECPANYTQAQVDATGCYVGALIGSSWLWGVLGSLFIEFVVIILSVFAYVASRFTTKKKK